METVSVLKGGVCCAAMVVIGCGGAASASIIGVSGASELIVQPGDARLNVLTSLSRVRVWDEFQNVTLVESLHADARDNGLYDQASDLQAITIAAGRVVSSHYIHFDSPGSQSAVAEGSVQFSGEIVGVIVDNAAGVRHLDNSDYLGAPTLFTKNENARGLEFGSDRFMIITGNTITYRFSITSPGDFVRVITVPAPAGLAILGGGLLAVRRRRV